MRVYLNAGSDVASMLVACGDARYAVGYSVGYDGGLVHIDEIGYEEEVFF